MPAVMTPVLAYHGISRRFGSIQALKEVCIDASAGGVFGVFGTSCSGRTTLLGISMECKILMPERINGTGGSCAGICASASALCTRRRNSIATIQVHVVCKSALQSRGVAWRTLSGP